MFTKGSRRDSLKSRLLNLKHVTLPSPDVKLVLLTSLVKKCGDTSLDGATVAIMYTNRADKDGNKNGRFSINIQNFKSHM